VQSHRDLLRHETGRARNGFEGSIGLATGRQGKIPSCSSSHSIASTSMQMSLWMASSPAGMSFSMLLISRAAASSYAAIIAGKSFALAVSGRVALSASGNAAMKRTSGLSRPSALSLVKPAYDRLASFA